MAKSRSPAAFFEVRLFPHLLVPPAISLALRGEPFLPLSDGPLTRALTRHHDLYKMRILGNTTIKSMRLAKSFMVDAEINDYVDTTKGDRSASERVNELLKRAILAEQYERLEAEAAAFFADAAGDRGETKRFQDVALRTFGRD